MLAEICHFHPQKYYMFSLAKSSRFLHLGYCSILIKILTKEFDFDGLQIDITGKYITKL